eukprot:959870-Prorocentrum_minimum.AAC.1
MARTSFRLEPSLRPVGKGSACGCLCRSSFARGLEISSASCVPVTCAADPTVRVERAQRS